MSKPKLWKPKQEDLEHIKTLKKLTAEDIHRMIKESAERIKEDKRKRNEPPKDERTGSCVFCEGKVIARVTRVHHGELRLGGHNSMRTIHHGFHCTECGLRYEFPPKRKNDEGEK